MQPGEGLISALALQGHLFALATPDGRVRAYDTVTGRLRSRLATAAASEAIQGKGQAVGLPKGHLADGLQCLAWVDDEASAKARSGNPASTSTLAVGTAAGIVRAYDSATGSVRWQTEDCNDGGVTCVADGGPHGLLCSGHDGQVACLDPATGAVRRRFRGSKHAVTGGAAAPDGSKLLIGGSTLALVDVESGARIAKFSGHATPVRAVAFAPGGRHAVSAAASERAVAVWNTSGSKKAMKLGGVAVASLPVDDAAVALCTCDAPGGEPGAFYAAAVTEAGEAFVWLCTPEGEGAVLAAAAARVRVGEAKAAPAGDAILAAGLEPADGGATLVVVRGSSAKPVFERVPIAAPQPGGQQQHQQQPTHCLEPSVEGALLKGGKQQQAAQKPVSARGGGAAAAANGPLADVEMLGPENDGALVRPRAAAAAAAGAGKKRAAPEDEEEEGDEEGDEAAADGDAAASSDDEGLDGEETLGARVAALELGDAAAEGEEDADAAAASAAGAALLDGAIKADSLAVLLQQALRSGDKALLERCLGLSDARVVRNSVRRLLPVDAAALLRACVERLQSRPVRGQQLAGWIRAVLLHHTAYLMAAPGVQPVMTSLYQTIEARMATQRTLLSLSGRLDLLLAQSGPAGASAGGDDDAAAPRAVYQESDSEDGGAEVVVEDAFAPRLGDSDEDEDEDDSLGGTDDADTGDEDEGEDGSQGGSGDDMEEDD